MRASCLTLTLTLLAVSGGLANAGGSPYGSPYHSIGHSVSEVAPFWPGSEGAPYGTSALGNSVAVIQINTARDAGARAASFSVLPGAAGPKIIDVEQARLDRRPYGADGLDIVYSGTTKIIRVSPDFRRARVDVKDDVQLGPIEGATAFAKLSPAEQAVTVYPDPDEPLEGPMVREPAPAIEPAPSAPARDEPTALAIPVPTPAPAEGRVASTQTAPATPSAPSPAAAPSAATPTADSLEPWTDEWLRDCVARHSNFDASLGTYTDEAGRRRFCTGEGAR